MAAESVESDLPVLLREQVERCMFPRWYEQFRHVTIKSTCIPLPEPFLETLLSDEFHVDASAFPTRHVNEYDQDSDDEWDYGEGAGKTDMATQFPDLNQAISDCIAKYEGGVLPKLNWSSPKDAVWMNTCGTLRCERPVEIYMLLKSSDFIVHDLCHPFDECSDVETEQGQNGSVVTPGVPYTLVLRKWSNLHAGREFRVFVNEKKIAAVTQRDTAYYEHLEREKQQIVGNITKFFSENEMCSKLSLDHFVFDVYVDKSMRVWLVDVSPFCKTTESILLQWDEILSSRTSQSPLVRFADALSAATPGIGAYNRVPQDVVSRAAQGGVEDLVRMMQLAEKGQQPESSESDEER